MTWIRTVTSKLEIELENGAVVTPQEHYMMLCQKYGLRVGVQIMRDPSDPERWIEKRARVEVVHAEEPTDTVG